MFDSSSFAKGYAIIILSIVAIIILSVIVKDIKNKKVKDDIRRNGIHALAEIINVESYAGKISQYTNIKLYYRYKTEQGRNMLNEGTAVIFTSDLKKYSPGEAFPIIYSKTNPDLVIIEIENASLKHK
ncbi:nuclease [Cronobacter dublinensis]